MKSVFWLANEVLEMNVSAKQEKELINVNSRSPFIEPKKFSLNHNYELYDNY